MQSKDLTYLLEKYNNGTATNEEKALIENWYLKHKPANTNVTHEQLQEDQQNSLDQLVAQIKSDNKRSIWPALKIAASVLIFLSAGLYFIKWHNIPKERVAINKPLKNDVAPGGYKATITLANGSKIVLNDIKTGKLASQGNTLITKTANGKIIYINKKPNAVSNTLVYNIATTQRGGLYQFVLADGTKVWLNSASSIKYPVNFIGNERVVELTGEAYFEVAHNAKKSFKVIANGQTIEDIGTHFNINAYNDEDAIKTTLLEGSVKVSTASMSRVLKPGEQAFVKNGNLSITNVDPNESVAWKNGFFFFNDNTIQDVMKQLARWYDVDIKYEGELSERRFSGEITRNINASQILDILSFKKIHYKIEGKTITVMP